MRIWVSCIFGLIAALPLSNSALGGSPIAVRFGVGDPFAEDPTAQVEKRLELYKRAGIGVLRVDVDWRTQEIQRGSWRETPNLALLQLGQRGGFKLKANIGSLHSPPVWFFEQHPDAQLKNQDGLPSYNDISYWYPGLRAILEEKDDHLFASLSRLGLLRSVTYLVVPLGPAGESLYPTPSTSTEPMRFWFYDPNAQADFPRRMREKYGTILAANTAWGTNFVAWPEVVIPLPRTRSGPFWRDVLEWYRDTKRNFTVWQLQHYRRLLNQYFPTGPQPKLLILVPGNHITASEWQQAVRSGEGADTLKMMSDSEFLLDAAHRIGADTQYTGLPNLSEIEYLQSYARGRGYRLAMWGENAGNAGEPRELDEEVLANGLFGQEHIGTNLFEADHVTPTARYEALKTAHAWLADVWTGQQPPVVTFDLFLLAQNACIYADQRLAISLCMQDDANLVLRMGARSVWMSNTSHRDPGFCGADEDPASTCHATFQGDGNLVVSRGTQPLWGSGTSMLGRHLVLSSSPPYLEILSHDGHVIWTAASN